MTEKPKQPFAFTLTQAVTTLVFWRIVAAIVSGLLLSASFPPLCWNLGAWVALVPIIFMPQPRSWKQRFGIGYLFGYVHFATTLHWLNEVGFGAGYLLALYCALFPMLWYAFLCALLWQCKDLQASNIPGESILFIRSSGKLALVAIAGTCCWTALEWLRAWLFTGFPWNQVGISQYTHVGLLQTAAYTGVYGASFLIILTNFAVACELGWVAWMLMAHKRHPFPWHFVALAIALIPVCILANLPHELPTDKTPTMDALVIQGNLPQQRVWTHEQLNDSLKTYIKLTLEGYEAAPSPKPSLVIWPEAAIPAPLNYDGFRLPRNELLRRCDSQFLIGAIHHRANPDDPEDPLSFNSAFLLDTHTPAAQCHFNPADHITDFYDKVHRVPFGEYTPGARYFPWLRELIGMGRDLTPGTGFHPITFANGAKAGVNICFEDVFPDVSRQLVRNGAQLLMTITNDSWYNHSSGAHQHMTHVVFRAAETRRPFLRCGSNSHTCYVSPNGVISGMLRDTKNDSDFIAASEIYELPVHANLGTTFYVENGDVFAKFMFLLSFASLAWMVSNWLQLKKQRLKVLQDAEEEQKQHPNNHHH